MMHQFPGSSKAQSQAIIRPYVEIVEQPASKTLRFRYPCEGRSAPIPGVNSTPDSKTFPTIKIVNYIGPVLIITSCVTIDAPYRPHPHNLVGKEGFTHGISKVEFDAGPDRECSFQNLGIQCVKRNEVTESLRKREKYKVDPFKTGFDHKDDVKDINLNAVRLCFQVFTVHDKELQPLTRAVVSDIIHDKKSNSDLIIYDICDVYSPASGGKKNMLFCEKVLKEDISIRFYEQIGSGIVWEALADFQSKNVHKQVGIAFKTPKYRITNLEQPVNVFVQLLRPSDRAISQPIPFQYVPDHSASFLKKKRKLNNEKDLFDHLGNHVFLPSNKMDTEMRLFRNQALHASATTPKENPLPMAFMPFVKAEIHDPPQSTLSQELHQVINQLQSKPNLNSPPQLEQHNFFNNKKEIAGKDYRLDSYQQQQQLQHPQWQNSQNFFVPNIQSEIEGSHSLTTHSTQQLNHQNQRPLFKRTDDCNRPHQFHHANVHQSPAPYCVNNFLPPNNQINETSIRTTAHNQQFQQNPPNLQIQLNGNTMFIPDFQQIRFNKSIPSFQQQLGQSHPTRETNNTNKTFNSTNQSTVDLPELRSNDLQILQQPQGITNNLNAPSQVPTQMELIDFTSVLENISGNLSAMQISF